MEPVQNIRLSRFLLDTIDFTREEFIEQFPVPFLEVELLSNPDGSDVSETKSTQRGILKGKTKEGQAIIVRNEDLYVSTVEKSGRNTFHDRITLGRAGNNDIFVPHLAVSKLHGYFRYDDESGKYTLSDVGSTNGTTIGGDRLEPNQPYTLESGIVILLGGHVRTLFRLPGDFFTHLTKLKKQGLV
jgi:pSer/pThr/pTyr-binding forkhead associated (FHA) protein